jgi:16S rRNA (cytosine1402-N4)-methyltransferase
MASQQLGFWKIFGRQRLEELLVERLDEPYANVIAEAIIRNIKSGVKIQTTTHLKDCIKEALDFLPPSESKDMIKKSCQRTFQALRLR